MNSSDAPAVVLASNQGNHSRRCERLASTAEKRTAASVRTSVRKHNDSSIRNSISSAERWWRSAADWAAILAGALTSAEIRRRRVLVIRLPHVPGGERT